MGEGAATDPALCIRTVSGDIVALKASICPHPTHACIPRHPLVCEPLCEKTLATISDLRVAILEQKTFKDGLQRETMEEGYIRSSTLSHLA